MKTVRPFLSVAICVLLFASIFSCSTKPTKEQYMEQFSTFVDEVTRDAKEYTQEDWNKADKTFRDFIEQNGPAYDSLLTKEDRRQIGKLQGRYTVLRAKSGFKMIKKELNEIKDQGQGFFEALIEGLKENGIDLEKLTK